LSAWNLVVHDPMFDAKYETKNGVHCKFWSLQVDPATTFQHTLSAQHCNRFLDSLVLAMLALLPTVTVLRLNSCVPFAQLNASDEESRHRVLL